MAPRSGIGGDHGLGDGGRDVALPIGRPFDQCDVGEVFRQAVAITGRAVAAVDRGEVTHERKGLALAAERLTRGHAGILTHLVVVGPHDHGGLASGRPDVERHDGHILVGRKLQRRDDRLAVGGDDDDPVAPRAIRLWKSVICLPGFRSAFAIGSVFSPVFLAPSFIKFA